MIHDTTTQHRIAPQKHASIAAVVGRASLLVVAALLAVAVVFAAVSAVPALALPIGIAIWVAIIGGLVALPVFAVQAIGESL
ncbi:hypothetical protein [Haloarchaeobius sp. HME9146]|uniref:hypothetical protein n=1 Tax=Haloarchaeobius sp. HME9146 TaxID=2978732 RepID=UPI0021C0097E|nr:hypothetical protein [Haloarchaeobius sp. HME9146]MCT9094495.1 hypothetical protein [Haloarchaeobius sp. HME9146]